MTDAIATEGAGAASSTPSNRGIPIEDEAIDLAGTYHFHLFRVVRIAVIGLNERAAPVEYGRDDETEREHVARSAHRRLRLHFGRCNSAKRGVTFTRETFDQTVWLSLI